MKYRILITTLIVALATLGGVAIADTTSPTQIVTGKVISSTPTQLIVEDDSGPDHLRDRRRHRALDHHGRRPGERELPVAGGRFLRAPPTSPPPACPAPAFPTPPA